MGIAVEGRTATGAEIPMVAGEIDTYANREGAFFGNMLDPTDGLYACSEWMSQVPRSYSGYRVCTCNYWPAEPGDGCLPIQQLGVCNQVCQIDTANWIYYKSCTLNGRTYRPITALQRHSDVWVCGDGVCQATEKCGTGTRADACADCGPCP